MSSFQFGQLQSASKDFYKKKQATNIITANLKKVMVSDEVLCNFEKD